MSNTPEDNLSRWVDSGDPAEWVRQHNLKWNHQDWLDLLASLRRSEFWPMDPDAIGGVLEAAFAQVDEDAVRKLTDPSDQPLLAKLALNSCNRSVRLYAAERVNDQFVLAKSAMRIRESDSPYEFGATYDSHKAALYRLTDPAALAMVAKGARELCIRQEAVRMVSDQMVLAEVAMTDDYEGLRKETVNRLTDPAALARVATGARDGYIRMTAVEKVSDQRVLAEVATTDEYEWVRTVAIKRVTDQSLLAKGNSKKTHTGQTTLMVASASGNRELVQSVLDKGADVNDKDSSGDTPLMNASRGGHLEVVRLLLDKGADVNTKLWNGMTALIMASRSGHREVVQALLDKGADIKAKDQDGMTVLMYASGEGHHEVVRVLLDKGADVNAKMSPTKMGPGGTALTMAKNAKVRALLVGAGAGP